MNKLEKTDEEIISSIKNNKNVSSSLKTLIDRHSGICVSIINSYIPDNFNNGIKQEIIKEKDYQIYQAALKFDSKKNTKFSTYLGLEVKWKCLNIYNKTKKQKTTSVESELIDHFNYFAQENQASIWDGDVFNFIIKKAETHPDKRVGKIFYLRYVVGQNNSVMPWKNVSKEIGMSIQGCINIHNSMIKNFKNNIKKEKL
jgi:hypothetical protein